MTIRADVNVSEQCGIAASKGNQRVIKNLTYKLIIPLHKAEESN